MTTQEVAGKLVHLCRQTKLMEAIEALYADDIVSVEAVAPPGQSRESKGFATIKAKNEWWMANHEVHSSTVDEPLVAGSHFATTFKMDLTFKPENRRFYIEEVAVYEVKDGKVVHEQFFYNLGA